MAQSKAARWVRALGGERRNFVVSVFVPSQTRDGDPIDHASWRMATMKEMARLFGGATAYGGTGAWRDDERDGEILTETISHVFSYMAKSVWTEETASELAVFLRRMGRETSQGEVGINVNGEYLPIREFDE